MDDSISPRFAASTPAGDGDLAGIAVRLTTSCAYLDRLAVQDQETSAGIRPLVRLVRAFVVNLLNQTCILGRAGRAFPDREQFLQTLHACEDFLRRHTEKALASRGQGLVATSRSSTAPVDLSPVAFENENENLVGKLKAHSHAMNSWSLYILLSIALHDKDILNLPQRQSVASLIPTEDLFIAKFRKLYEQLHDRLVVFQNRHRQKRTRATVGPSHSDTSDFGSVLQFWHSILLESGLQEDEIPRIPADAGRTALEAAAERFRPAYMAEGAAPGPSLPTPLSAVDMTAASTQSSSPAASRTGISLRDPFDLSSSRSDDDRQFYFPSNASADAHRTDSIASSQSSAVFTPALSPRGTGFSDITTGSSPAATRKTSREDQGMTSRHLHKEIDIKSISSSMSTEAADQCMKLWRSPSCKTTTYLSYYANKAPQSESREFPLLWFDRPTARNMSNRTLRLTFVRPKRSISGESRRPSDDAAASGEVDDTESTSGESAANSSVPPFLSGRILAEKFKYLDIDFEGSEEAKGFLDSFLLAYDSDVAQLEPKPVAMPAHSVIQRASRSSTSATTPTQRATPMGILGLSFTLEQMGLN